MKSHSNKTMKEKCFKRAFGGGFSGRSGWSEVKECNLGESENIVRLFFERGVGEGRHTIAGDNGDGCERERK